MADTTLLAHFQQLAAYNHVANERLYAACRALSHDDYYRERESSFPGIHATLNHLLVGDRIWMSRYTGHPESIPLGTILYADHGELWSARQQEDERLRTFVAALTPERLAGELSYVNSAGLAFRDPLSILLLHQFNHQTHHRGQITVMLRQAGLKPPSLDLHRIARPAPAVS